MGRNLADEIQPNKMCRAENLQQKEANATRKTDYQLHGHTLEVVDASMYLGVTLTEDHGTSTFRTQ